MNINSPNRALCTPDPVENQFLPLSDEYWNKGVCNAFYLLSQRFSQPLQTPPSGAPYTVSFSCNGKVGKFARLAQAAHLLSRVLRHLSDTETGHEFLDNEREALDRALRSLLLLTVSEEELCGVAYCSPVAVLSRYVFVEN
jgi:hypothetical protein